MKKLILLLSFVTIICSAKAQYVTIPDANFVAKLQILFPSCMSGNQMDTTCAAITSATTLSLIYLSIADLTGVQYFDNLQTLNCYNNQLTYLPTLPNSLLTLKCQNNQLTSLPTLPNSLQTLWCGFNQITNLPVLPNSLQVLRCDDLQLTSLPVLPNSLQVLYCYNNQITSLPILPNTLQELICSNNPLTSWPLLPNSLYLLNCGSNQLTSLPILPNSLLTLNCSYNQLTSLLALPNLLQYLDCDLNQLTSLPVLPNSLQTLHCRNNQLTSLPTLQNSIKNLWCSHNLLGSLPTLPNSLLQLACDNNQLISLPALPNSLNWLHCYTNQLTSLPVLPNTLVQFRCENNNISCLPILPSSLTDSNTASFYISNNPFTCLPNYVLAMNSTNLAYPLCLTGNVNGCPIAQGIIGYTYKDNNSNCLYSTADSTKRNVHEKLYDSVGTLIGQTFSAMNGVYDFPQPTGTYTVKIDTAGYPYITQCAHPGIDSTVVLTSAAALQTNVDFDIACKQGFDIGAQSIVRYGNIFPGQVFKIRCVAGDLSNWFGLHCANGISGQVVVTVTGPVTYMNSLAGTLTPTVAGNVFTYTVANFGTISSSTAFGLVFTTNSTAQNGDVICINVSVTPTAGDNNTSNNTFNYCYTVVNSFDPNYKETYPEIVPPAYNDYFYYTVQFQNTGTAPAININLQDTLDANLDLNTFQITNYSHYCTSLLNGNKLSFNFPNIQLPDSTSDFDGSQGFVQYRIKPLPGLPSGTHIYNKASIYFDFNAPVVTNTTNNEFMSSVVIGERRTENGEVIISPNPFTEQTTITFSESQKHTTIKILDVLGKEIKTIHFTGKQLIIEKGEMEKGIYFVLIMDENKNTINKKIVIQ